MYRETESEPLPFPHRADIYIRRHALLKKDDLVSCYEMVKKHC